MKLKNILFIAIAILTIGLFVACNDDVVVAAKDNNVAYTQVLESNGAFEYAGTKYETLQDAIEAIDKAKGYASKTIKVLRDVNSDGATVPATTVNSITLDLNGKTLSFLTSTGVTTNGVFYVEGEGEVTFAEGVTNGTAFVVNKDGKLTVTNTTINVADQYAVKASGEGAAVTFGTDAAVAGNIAASDKAHINLQSGSEVSGTMSTSGSDTAVQVYGKYEGNIDATGGSSVSFGNNAVFTGNLDLNGANATLTGSSTFTDGGIVALGTGATFNVSNSNEPTITLNLDGGTLSVSTKAALSSDSVLTGGTFVFPEGNPGDFIEIPSEVIIPSDVHFATGHFSITKYSTVSYYPNLQEAINDADGTYYTINQLFTDTTAATVDKTIILNTKDGCSVGSSTNVITVNAGKTLTITGTGTVENLVANGTVNVENATITTVSSGTGSIISKNALFTGTVTVGTLVDGTATSGDTPEYANGSEFKSDVTVTGSITFNNSKLTGGSNTVKSTGSSITANSVTFGVYDSSAATPTWTAGQALQTGEAGSDSDTQGGVVTITNGEGLAGNITTHGSDVTINNSAATTKFEVGTITTAKKTIVEEITSYSYADVTVKGNSTTNVVTVAKIDTAVDVMTSYAVVTGDIGSNTTKVTTVSDGWTVLESTTPGYSTFNGNIYASGAGTFNNSIFTPVSTATSDLTLRAGTLSITSATFNVNTSSKVYGLEATGADYSSTSALKITNSTGKVASLTATAGSINVANASASTALTVTGNVLAGVSSTTTYYDVTLVGKSGANVVINGTIDGNDISLTYATVNDNVTAHDNAAEAPAVADLGSVVATSSTFDTLNVASKTISGSALSFTSSTFTATVASGTASNFYALEATGADYYSTSALKITTSTGKVASLTATAGSITVDNTDLNNTTTAADVNFTVAGNVSAKDSGTTYFDITLKGDEPATVSSNKYSRNVVVTGTIDGNDIVLNYATVNDNVTAHDNAAVAPAVADLGSVVATSSTFDTLNAASKTISGSTLSFTSSTFTATASSGTASNFYALEASGADPDENTSALKITTSTGTVKSLTATAGSIKVANGSATASLTVTGNVLAKNNESTPTYYDVTLTGSSTEGVVLSVGAITGNKVDSTRATVTGEVHASANVVSKSSVFQSTVTAATTVADGTGTGDGDLGNSTFNGAVQTGNGQTYYGSTFASAASLTTTSTGNISITLGKGTTGAVLVYNGSFTVSNSDAKAEFGVTSVNLVNSHSVSITGNADAPVNVTGEVGTTDAGITGASATVGLTHANVTNDIGTTTKVGDVTTSNSTLNGAIYAASVTDGEATSYGKSEFKGNITATNNLKFYGSKFTNSPAINSTYAGKIDLYNCEGSVGDIQSTGVLINSTKTVGAITIDNSSSTESLYGQDVKSFYDTNGDGVYDYSTDICGTISITSPNSSGRLVFGSTGDSRFAYSIIGETTLEDGNNNNAGTLFLYGGSGSEIDGSEFNAYGGQYGDAGDSFMIADNGVHTATFIHGGTFYTDEEQMLRFFSSHVHYNTSLPVEFKLMGNFTLGADLIIGKYTDGYRVNYNKAITFSSSDAGERTLTAYYSTSPSANYAVYVYAGTVTFNHVSLSNNDSDSFATLHYCIGDYGYYTFIDANLRKGKAVQDIN